MLDKLEGFQNKLEEQDRVVLHLNNLLETSEVNHRALDATVDEIVERELLTDEECLPTYDSFQQRCIIDQNVSFIEEVIFQDKVDFNTDETTRESPTVTFDTGVRFGTGGSLNIIEIGHDSIFEDNVKFEDDVEFEEDGKRQLIVTMAFF